MKKFCTDRSSINTSWKFSQQSNSSNWLITWSCGLVAPVFKSKDKVLCLRKKNRRSNDLCRQSVGLEKEIISPGDGATYPKNGQMVVIHYTACLVDGSVIDSSRSRGSPFKFKIGKGEVIKAAVLFEAYILLATLTVLTAVLFESYPYLATLTVLSAVLFETYPYLATLTVLSAVLFESYPYLATLTVLSAVLFETYP
ncbi:peptidylprolyl isomerase [Plakobranchus ocellatus]|uniref:peptidylprolyl isomerase n=1 Tax=Plakobranchus ocellatus TaxID=259542 RepID=A0AAV3YG78_9GAST|nr:peptidylprolyl isomerase [Plakobranchus ocellatus]